MLKFEFTFFIISLRYLGPAPEFRAVSSFSNKLIYFSYWLEIEFDFPQSHFCLPLETSRERTLISRKRAAWKRSMEGPATEQRPQWFPEEGRTGKPTSVIFLHFLSWSSPDRECPWEDFGERALSLCLMFHHIISHLYEEENPVGAYEMDILSTVSSRGICEWGEKRGAIPRL